MVPSGKGSGPPGVADDASGPGRTVSSAEALLQTLQREQEPLRSGAAEPAAAPPTGSSRFERGRELGRGGMGRVVEAIDRQFNRVVAVKEMHGRATNGDARRRFGTEALVTGNLEHPGIPSVYERGVDERGVPYYAMRKVSGRTLGAALADASDLASRLALLPVVIRTAQTLGYAHERGVIHRDVKPENIVVGAHGDVVLLDWGVARVRGLPVAGDDVAALAGGSGGGEERRSTVYGAVIGTPSYMSPEQADGRTDDVDERADVFSLGALLYHLLTGRPPYRGATVEMIIHQASEGRPEPPDEIEPQAPPALVAICTRAMARAPEDRYRNATELALALEEFESQAILSRPRSRLVSAAVAAALVFAVAAVALGTGALVLEVPSYSGTGSGILAPILLFIAGASLSAIEIRTRGRLALSSMAFAFALATFGAALASLAMGVGKTLVAAHHLAADGEAYRRAVGQGSWEATDTFLLSVGLAIAQFLVWGIARRTADVARAVVPPGGYRAESTRRLARSMPTTSTR